MARSLHSSMHDNAADHHSLGPSTCCLVLNKHRKVNWNGAPRNQMKAHAFYFLWIGSLPPQGMLDLGQRREHLLIIMASSNDLETNRCT